MRNYKEMCASVLLEITKIISTRANTKNIIYFFQKISVDHRSCSICSKSMIHNYHQHAKRSDSIKNIQWAATFILFQ